MKKLIIILLLVTACGGEDPSPNAQGCQTGVNKQGERVLLRCCTKAQFDMGDNVSKGGTKLYDSYANQQWELCDKCK